jgi:biotin carboxyl carrier protein
MAEDIAVTRVADGVYRVVHQGRSEIVYVAGPASERWAFWNGRVFRGDVSESPRRRTAPLHGVQVLTAPMPATVLDVPVKAGDTVKKGDVVLLLEAMKMELPIRAPGDALVTAVHCREGELVQADAVLIELG